MDNVLTTQSAGHPETNFARVMYAQPLLAFSFDA